MRPRDSVISTSLSCTYLTASLMDKKLVTSGCHKTMQSASYSVSNGNPNGNPKDNEGLKRETHAHQTLHSNIYFNDPGPLHIVLPTDIFERLKETRI
jgi:hypothetical protein